MKITMKRFLNEMEILKQDYTPSDQYNDYLDLTEEKHYILSLLGFTDFHFCSDYVKTKPGDNIPTELFKHFNITYQQFIEFNKQQTKLYFQRIDLAFD